MTSRSFVTAFAVASCVALPAGGQAAHWTSGVGVGGVYATTGIGAATRSGMNVTGFIGRRVIHSRAEVRLEGSVTRTPYARAVDHLLAHSLGASLAGNLDDAVWGGRLYIIGGGAAYWLKANRTHATTVNLGLDAGGGWARPLGGVTAFLESRFRFVQRDEGDLQFVPVVFGVRW